MIWRAFSILTILLSLCQAGRRTSTVTTIVTSTLTEVTLFRAGLVLINSLSIHGIDAYKKDFTVENEASISFANVDMNIFAIPTDATCMVISTVEYKAALPTGTTTSE